MALDKQKILNELGSVVNQLQGANCGCMGKLFSNAPENNSGNPPTHGGGYGSCGHHCHSCHHNQGWGMNAPCGGEPHSNQTPPSSQPQQANQPWMSNCNPRMLYANTYKYLNQNLMQPVLKEVYEDLKSITPANTIANTPLANKLGLGNPAMGQSQMGGGEMGNMPQNQMAGGGIGNMPQNQMAGGGMGNMPQNQMAGGGMGNMPQNQMAGGGMGNMPQNQMAGGGMGNMPQNQMAGGGMGNVPQNQMAGGGSTYGNAQGNTMVGNMSQNMNPTQPMGGMAASPMQQQMTPHNQATHGKGSGIFNSMFPGVMQGLEGGLDFDPMSIAIQMNPSNQQQAAMDSMNKVMMGNKEGIHNLFTDTGDSTAMQPAIKGTNAVAASLAQSQPAQMGQNVTAYQAASMQQNVPTAYQPGQMQQNVPTAYQAGQMQQNVPTAYQPGQLQQSVPTAYQPGQLQQNVPTGYQPGQLQQSVPTAYQPGQMQQNVPTAYQPGQLQQSVPIAYQPGQMQQNVPAAYQPGQMQQNVPPAYQHTQMQQNTPTGYQQMTPTRDVGPAYQHAHQPSQQQPQQQIYSAHTGALTMNQQEPKDMQYQQFDPRTGVALPYGGSGDPNVQPESYTQQRYKEPIFPADPSRQPYYSAQQVRQMPTTRTYPGTDQQSYPSQRLPSRMNEPMTYSNVKSTVSKTSLMGLKRSGNVPSRSQLQNIYNQYKGSHSYTQQNVKPAERPTHSAGNLNLNNVRPLPVPVPVERVGGDTVYNPINNLNAVKVDHTIGRMGDVPANNKPMENALKEEPPSKQSRCRNGLQDVVFTSYPTSAAWSFHGNHGNQGNQRGRLRT